MSFNGPIHYPPEPLKPETIFKSGFIPYGFTSLKEATQRPDFAKQRAGKKTPKPRMAFSHWSYTTSPGRMVVKTQRGRVGLPVKLGASSGPFDFDVRSRHHLKGELAVVSAELQILMDEDGGVAVLHLVLFFAFNTVRAGLPSNEKWPFTALKDFRIRCRDCRRREVNPNWAPPTPAKLHYNHPSS
ncbi:uncharacterized protein B0T23DRAFT_391700 [Neurospora hispaniola]|uniref:Uncharacterized protein n=1 Tax=Neurospora hispaniola TaxID=588809 RepID=A0AAJ0IF06_9PEZI|nr:hypothetical protein B0T23DRAFT_391700 [Neurospora hispaniola]